MQIISNLSLWWLIPILIISIGSAIFLYQKQRSTWNAELTKNQRFLLTSLRAFSVFLIGILLLGILVQYRKNTVQKPILAIAIDNSTSMLNYADSLSLANDVTAFTERIDKELGNKYVVHFLTACGKPNEVSFPLSFDQERTNLYQGFEGIKKRFFGQNLASIVLISDGNINEGNLPQYAIQDLLQTSVYTIGVGDSTFKPDLAIKHISANDIALLGNFFLVNVDVQAFGFQGEDVKVELLNKGNVLASKVIHLADNKEDIQSLLFEVEAKNIGIQAYTVKVEQKKGEYTYINNSSTFYVNVIDGRNRVLLLADGPHPDLKALERALERDENTKVEFHLLDEWKRDLKDVTLVVVHSPGAAVNTEVAKFIGNAPVSKLYILGTASDQRFFQTAGGGVNIANSRQTDDVSAAINIDFNLFQLDGKWEQNLKNWSPLKMKFGAVNYPQGAKVLMNQKIGPVVKAEPLIYFTEQQTGSGRTKIGVIGGEGIWRWRMSDYALNKSFDVFDGLMTKMVQYLSVKQNTDQLRVQAPKSVSTGKDVEFNASVYNATFELTTKPQVKFELVKEDKVLRKLEFSAKDSSYHLNLGKLNAGIYKWKAYTEVAGKKLSKTGELVVDLNRIEQLDVRANHQLLKELAENGNGVFTVLNNADSIIEELKNRKDLTSKSYLSIELKELVSFFWLFLILVLSLCTEWFLRRFLGNY